jgi:hypothetical protein
MTDHTDKLIEQRIAEMTPEQFDALVARTRPPEVAALKERAAAMLRGETPPAAEPATLSQREVPWNPNAAKPAPELSAKDRAAEAVRNHLNNR